MIRPTASDWERAVSRVYNTYPTAIFPPDSDSPDAKAGTWARKVCLNIITEAWQMIDRADVGMTWTCPTCAQVYPDQSAMKTHAVETHRETGGVVPREASEAG